ncbi:hypothetical protein ACKLNR_013164 [Fusarium oxysporum f. sp. zingiberi]
MLQAHPGPLPPLHRNYIGVYDVFEAFENIVAQFDSVFQPTSSYPWSARLQYRQALRIKASEGRDRRQPSPRYH